MAATVGVDLESEKDEQETNSISEPSSAMLSERQRASKLLQAKIETEVKRSQENKKQIAEARAVLELERENLKRSIDMVKNS